MCVNAALSAHDCLADSLKRLISLSRAEMDDLVSVAGPDGIEALGLLCRENFERVQCARQATCAGADGASDVLILAGVFTGAALIPQLLQTVRLLRDGGVLANQLEQLDDDLDLQLHLGALGIEVTSTVFDLSKEVLVAHTLSSRTAMQRAA